MTVELDGTCLRPEGLAGGSRAIETALTELRRGRAVYLRDGERGGCFVAAAREITATTAELMSRSTTGMLCVALSAERAGELGVHPSAAPASADVKAGTTSGMSLGDRVRTVRALADPATGAADFSWPGHVFLLRAHSGGVLRRAGSAEAAVDLCRLAGLPGVAALVEAADAGLVSVTHDDVLDHRLAAEQLVRREAAARIPTEHGQFTAVGYRSLIDDSEHVALVLGDVDQRAESATAAPVLTHVHVECLTGDVFGSARCDCSRRLRQAMAQVGAAGRGVVVYLRSSEGPAPHGEAPGGDRLGTVVSSQILRDLGVSRTELPTDGVPPAGFAPHHSFR